MALFNTQTIYGVGPQYADNSHGWFQHSQPTLFNNGYVTPEGEQPPKSPVNGISPLDWQLPDNRQGLFNSLLKMNGSNYNINKWSELGGEKTDTPSIGDYVLLGDKAGILSQVDGDNWIAEFTSSDGRKFKDRVNKNQVLQFIKQPPQRQNYTGEGGPYDISQYGSPEPVWTNPNGQFSITQDPSRQAYDRGYYNPQISYKGK